MENLPDEENEIFGGADRLRPETGGVGHASDRGVQEDGRYRAELLPLEAQVRRHGRSRTQAPEAARG